MIRTDAYEGLLAETITMIGANSDRINAYMARPLGPGTVTACHPAAGSDTPPCSPTTCPAIPSVPSASTR